MMIFLNTHKSYPIESIELISCDSMRLTSYGLAIARNNLVCITYIANSSMFADCQNLYCQYVVHFFMPAQTYAIFPQNQINEAQPTQYGKKEKTNTKKKPQGNVENMRWGGKTNKIQNKRQTAVNCNVLELQATIWSDGQIVTYMILVSFDMCKMFLSNFFTVINLIIYDLFC